MLHFGRRKNDVFLHFFCFLSNYSLTLHTKKTSIMNNLRYSIIYAVIRPEIAECISVGLIFVDGNKIDVRYSQQKLDALSGLFL